MRIYCPKACGFCGAAGDAKNVVDNTDAAAADKAAVKCKDKNKLCSFWATSGECEANPKYMTTACAKSCGTCDKVVKRRRKATAVKQTQMTQMYPDDVDPAVAEAIMDKSSAIGVRQLASGVDTKATLQRIEDALNYMTAEKTLALPKNILDNCSHKHELCAFWASLNECENNRAFMTVQCSPSCFSCELIDIGARCPPLDDAEPALRPGDLQKV
jgi:prolyl 4-hydroxylase